MTRLLSRWVFALLFACSLASASDLDLNTASADALTAVPGIGPSRAAAIVAWRAEHGPFARVEDVSQVPGCGPATVRALREHTRVAAREPASPPQPTPALRAQIDINRADLPALQQLPGIGPTKARLILEHREAHGPFPSCDALARVPGFTRATVIAVGDRCVTGDAER